MRLDSLIWFNILNPATLDVQDRSIWCPTGSYMGSCTTSFTLAASPGRLKHDLEDFYTQTILPAAPPIFDFYGGTISNFPPHRSVGHVDTAPVEYILANKSVTDQYSYIRAIQIRYGAISGPFKPAEGVAVTRYHHVIDAMAKMCSGRIYSTVSWKSAACIVDDAEPAMPWLLKSHQQTVDGLLGRMGGWLLDDEDEIVDYNNCWPGGKEWWM